MKFKLSILLTVLFSIAMTAFGQKEPVKPTKETKPTTDTKPADTKTPAAKLPTAQEILAKYVQALGGKEANEKIKSRMAKGTIELAPMGVKGTFESYAVPGKSINRMNLAGIGEMIEALDGTSAWSSNPIQGIRDKQGDELAQTKLINDFHREIKLDKLFPKMEVKGVEKVGDNDAYVVVGTPVGLPPETFYFDTKSGLLLRQDATFISPEGNQPVRVFFEDYRDVDGVKVFFKSRTVLPQAEVITINTEVKNNVTIEDSKFTKPKA